MSYAQAVKPVKGIVPNDINKFFSENLNIDDVFLQCVEGSEYKTKLTRKEIRQQKKDEKDFEKIRNNLVLNAFGMSKEDYQKFLEVYEEIQNGEHDFDVSDVGNVKRKMAVANAQNKSNKRASKGWISGLAKGLIFTVGGLSLGTVLSPVLAPVLGPVIASKFVEGSIVCASAGYALYRSKKSEKGNIGDYQQKQMDADEELVNLIKKIQTLEESLVADKQLILDKKKELKKDDFNSFVVDYLNEKMVSLGLLNGKASINENEINSFENEIVKEDFDENVTKNSTEVDEKDFEEKLKNLENLNKSQMGG